MRNHIQRHGETGLQRSSVGKTRLSRLRRALEASSIDLLILEDREGISWLCGSADADVVLVPAEDKKPVTAFTRKKEKFSERAWAKFETKGLSHLKETVKRFRAVEMASDSAHGLFSSHLRNSQRIRIRDGFTLFWKVASVKDVTELERFRLGASVAEKLMKLALENLETGVMEIDLNDKVMIEGRTLVYEENEKLDPLYPEYMPMIRGIIEDNPAVKITFGSSTAEPHALPRCRKLRENDIVSICLVPNIDGYWVELELTTFTGKPSPELFEYNRFKKELLEDTLELCCQGIRPCDIDKHVRRELKVKGVKGEVLHASGHGIGLKLHEPPILEASGQGLAEEPLESGQTLAIEPGFYFKRRYGFRDSVTIVIKRNKPEVVTNLPVLHGAFSNRSARN